MRLLFLTTALTFSLGISPASAQDDDEEIVVTATRAPAAALRLPAQIDVIDADDAAKRGATTLAEALAEAPGLGVVVSGGPGQQASLFAGGANSNHTLVLFDGLRINDPSTPGSSFDAGQDMLSDLARIEVVQGPMSAVFGSDAIGGVVNLIPRHGGEGALNARFDLATGSFGAVSGGAGADGTLGRLRYAVSAEGYASDGYDLVPERMSTHTGEDDGASMTTLTGVFDLALNDAFALDLLVRHREAQADFDPFPFDFVTFQEYRDEDDNLEISQNDLTLARVGATWTISPALSARATYGGIRQERAQSDDGAETDVFKGERRFGDITLTWAPNADAQIVGGISAESEDADIAQGFGFPPPIPAVDASADHVGAFVTAQRSFGALTLTGALRADDYEAFDTQLTGRIGASYAVLQNTRIYAAYGTSFRAPTLYERFVSFGDPSLDPEEGESREIGGDAFFAGFGQAHGFEISLLYRQSDITNLIDFGSSFTYANVDKAEIETAQARFGVRPLPWLSAHVAYVYTDAEDASANTPLLRRPQDYWTADLRVEQGPLSATLAWRQVGERADQLYGDDAFALGVGRAPSYAVTRAAIAYDVTPSTQVFLNADNLFDETYEPANGFAGAPANMMLGVRLRP